MHSYSGECFISINRHLFSKLLVFKQATEGMPLTFLAKLCREDGKRIDCEQRTKSLPIIACCCHWPQKRHVLRSRLFQTTACCAHALLGVDFIFCHCHLTITRTVFSRLLASGECTKVRPMQESLTSVPFLFHS